MIPTRHIDITPLVKGSRLSRHSRSRVRRNFGEVSQAQKDSDYEGAHERATLNLRLSGIAEKGIKYLGTIFRVDKPLIKGDRTTALCTPAILPWFLDRG